MTSPSSRKVFDNTPFNKTFDKTYENNGHLKVNTTTQPPQSKILLPKSQIKFDQ